MRLRPGGKEAASDYNSLGNLRVLAGNLQGAVESYGQALRCDPTLIEPAVNAVRLLVKLDRRSEAIQVLREISRRHPENLELRLMGRDLGAL